jgi:dihydroorotase
MSAMSAIDASSLAGNKDVPVGTRITITMPDDFHHHFRDGPSTKDIVAQASKQFARCIAMPNLKPPVTTTELALEYRQRILECVPSGSSMEPLMTL